MLIFDADKDIIGEMEKIPLEISLPETTTTDYDSMPPEKCSELILQNQLVGCNNALINYTTRINEAAFHRSRIKIRSIVKDIKHDFYIWQEPSERLLEYDREQFIVRKKELFNPFLSKLEGIVKEYNLGKQLGAVHSYMSALESIK